MFEILRFYQTAQRKQEDMVQNCDTDHLSYGQIYHKITNLKLLYMPSSKSKKVKLLKFVNVGSASIMKDT